MTCPRLTYAALSVLLPAFAAIGAPAQAAAWDSEKAHAECRDFKTYGMAEDSVYRPWFQAMYKHYGWTDCHRTDNDIGSAEVIAAYEAEKNNPQAVMADIGIAFGPVAAARGITLKYVPAGSDFVPAEYKEPGGGWIGSVVGAVGFTVVGGSDSAAAVKVAGAPQDYSGPMAKPHRMFVVTVTALLCALVPMFTQGGWLGQEWGLPAFALGLIAVGCVLTVMRRLLRAASFLKARRV